MGFVVDYEFCWKKLRVEIDKYWKEKERNNYTNYSGSEEEFNKIMQEIQRDFNTNDKVKNDDGRYCVAISCEDFLKMMDKIESDNRVLTDEIESNNRVLTDEN